MQPLADPRRCRRPLMSRVLAVVALGTLACDAPSEQWAAEPEETEREFRACLGDDCTYETVGIALGEASDGDTLRILPGAYRDGGILRANRVTILAEGVHLFGKAWERKAALVIKGRDTIIEGLRCSHVAVADNNGACIRAEGENLTLRRVHFHDAQSGLLTGRDAGRVVIEDSTFERLGNLPGEQGNAHAVYIGSIDELVLRRSRVLATRGQGHEVKSRAARNLIEDNVIASLDGRDSRLIDLPNGGDVVIRGNVLEEGPRSVNHDVIGIGLERRRGRGRNHERNQALVENNTLIVDRGQSYVFVHSRDVPEPVRRGNVIVGGAEPSRTSASEHWLRDRDSAGLAPFPFLPDAPLSAP